MNSTGETIIYVGTYTNGKSEGIYTVKMDKDGRLEVTGLAARLRNPTYMALSRDGKYLYSILENENTDGKTGGAAAAFELDGKTGTLGLLNIAPTIGKGPCYLTVDKNNRRLYTANYAEGSVTAFSLERDGSIGRLLSHIRHQGSGPDRKRQEGPHAHCVVLTPEETALCAVDLGLDQIIMYDLSAAPDGAISDEHRRITRIRPRSGPRHLAFHPNGKFAYLINELSSDITVLHYSPEAEEFLQKQYISALPESYKGENTCAAVKISSDGRFLYASNRGHDSIAIYNIDAETGILTACGRQPAAVSFPRDFEICPGGGILVAAGQYSGTLASFSIDKETGSLEPTGYTVPVDEAVCVKFGPPAF